MSAIALRRLPDDARLVKTPLGLIPVDLSSPIEGQDLMRDDWVLDDHPSRATHIGQVLPHPQPRENRLYVIHWHKWEGSAPEILPVGLSATYYRIERILLNAWKQARGE